MKNFERPHGDKALRDAAPRLFEACKDAVADLEYEISEFGIEGDQADRLNGIIWVLNGAITKAKG